MARSAAPPPDSETAWPHPRATQALIGHGDAVEALLDACRSGRLHHAWLLAGPDGIGKATLAYHFARFLLAGGADGGADTLFVDPSGSVPRQVAAESHPDLLTVERRWDNDKRRFPTELPVAEVRRIAPFLSMTAAGGGWRIVVIDDAERMNRSSANGILKILEEPPSRAVLLLVTTAPGALPPTILSRCRRLSLAPLATEEVSLALGRMMPGLKEVDRLAVAALAAGSIGRALFLARENGLSHYRALFDLLATMPAFDWQAAHRLIDTVTAGPDGRNFEAFALMLDGWLSGLVRQASGVPPSGPEAVVGEGDLRRRLAQGAGLDRWLELWEKTAALIERADRANLDRKTALLQAFSALADIPVG